MACTYTCYLIRYDGIDIRNKKITILSAEHQVWCVKTEIFHCSIDFLIEKNCTTREFSSYSQYFYQLDSCVIATAIDKLIPMCTIWKIDLTF